jgi:two-component system, sensor histidine kinase PdtaS
MQKSIDGQGKTPAVELSASSEVDAGRNRIAQPRRRPPSALLHQLSLAAVLQTRHAEPALLRYLSGLAAWIITFALRLLIRPLTPYSPFLLFIPGLMLVAWLWGRGPALLYLATTTIAVSIYFVPGAGLFRLDDATHLATALQFIVVGSAVIYIVGRLVAARLEIDRQLKNVSQLSSQQQTLLDEINHRVKNHLQAIIALTPAGQDERIDQIRVRMLVLARVYDKLTLRAAGATVDAENFLAELTSDFQNSLAPTGSIQLSHSVACGPLGSKEAVFIGLIANEVSNALKYAFPHRRGTIHLSLQERLGKRTLVVRDDGAGDAGKTKGTGQGRRLMGRLAKDLGGEVRIEGPPGYSVNVSYPLSALAS